MAQVISTAPAVWDAEIAALFQTAAHDPLVGVETVRRCVENGAALIVGKLGGVMCFAYVVSINQCEYGSEAVIVATAGVAVEGVRMARIIVEDVERRHRCEDRIRITASRPGAERILERMGYERQAVIYTKTVIGAGHVF